MTGVCVHLQIAGQVIPRYTRLTAHTKCLRGFRSLSECGRSEQTHNDLNWANAKDGTNSRCLICLFLKQI